LPSQPSEEITGLLLSGGLDSSILLGHLLHQGRRVRPFYVQSQLIWQRAELRAVRRLVRALSDPRLDDLVVLELPLADLYHGHWAVTGDHPPAADSPDEAMYLPGRNVLLSVKAALWCQIHGIGELALAVLGSSPFSDAKAGFFQQFQAVLNAAGPAEIRLLSPFVDLDKRAVMDLGRDLPLGLTFSCIAPRNSQHCGACNKCAERQKAFRLIGMEDPTRYAAATLEAPEG
jgi:7-cyano-7-deazaguanine synthase